MTACTFQLHITYVLALTIYTPLCAVLTIENMSYASRFAGALEVHFLLSIVVSNRFSRCLDDCFRSPRSLFRLFESISIDYKLTAAKLFCI